MQESILDYDFDTEFAKLKLAEEKKKIKPKPPAQKPVAPTPPKRAGQSKFKGDESCVIIFFRRNKVVSTC